MTSRGEPGERLGMWFSLCAISRFKIRPRAELHCFGWRKATLSAKASRLGGFTRSRPGRMSVAGLGTSTDILPGRDLENVGRWAWYIDSRGIREEIPRHGIAESLEEAKTRFMASWEAVLRQRRG